MVWMAAFIAMVLDLLIGTANDAAGPFDGVKVGLFIDDITVSDDLTYADLTQPTFTGYAVSSAVVWGDRYKGQDNRWKVTGTSKKFECSAGTPDETVKGCFYFTGTTPDEVLIGVELFEDDVLIDDVGKGVTVVPVLELPDGGVYGKAGVIA